MGLSEFEAQNVSFLKLEEETWRLKSCSIWLSQGDNNRIFFLHKYTKYRKNINYVWDIKGKSRVNVSTQKDLEK